MGMTDIDDKIITRAREVGVSYVDLARRCEASFLRDMQVLNVQSPNVIVRVTEHIDEIIDFAQRIIDNGYAYVDSEGSVYFNTRRFGTRYGKLNPSRQLDHHQLEGDQLPEDGEVTDFDSNSSDLDSGKRAGKHHPRDFALWKATKNKTEPGWLSPWGKGRPGWHIECSAMCSKIFGDSLDIHSGGVDLMFPHHENEIAQCEAFHEVDQWANYFLHSGHLHVDHIKMSKSLKNFITIDSFLSKYTSVQFRLFCLSSKYNTPIDYSEAHMNHAVVLEKKLLNFFNSVGNRLSVEQRYTGPLKDMWTEQELNLLDKLASARVQVGDALRDDFDTPSVMQILMDLISSSNVYLASNLPEERHVPEELLGNVASYIDQLLRLFGIELNTKYECAVSKRTADHLPFMNELLDIFIGFRGDVRNRTLEGLREAKMKLKKEGDLLSEDEIKRLKRAIEGHQCILKECDRMRDEILPALDIAVKDSKASSSWEIKEHSPDEAANFLQSRSSQVHAKVDGNSKVASTKIHRDGRKCANERRVKTQREFFASEGEFSVYDDETGVPLKAKDGQELSKNRRKKLAKSWNKYAKSHGL